MGSAVFLNLFIRSVMTWSVCVCVFGLVVSIENSWVLKVNFHEPCLWSFNSFLGVQTADTDLLLLLFSSLKRTRHKSYQLLNVFSSYLTWPDIQTSKHIFSPSVLVPKLTTKTHNICLFLSSTCFLLASCMLTLWVSHVWPVTVLLKSLWSCWMNFLGNLTRLQK